MYFCPMHWKKSQFYFIWQTFRYAKSVDHFFKMWSYRTDWANNLVVGTNSLNSSLAWLGFESIDLLNAYLKPDHRVFEYGGGGSTLFFLNRVNTVITVENNHTWVKMLKDTIGQVEHKNWEIHAIEGVAKEGQASKDPANPDHFATKNKGEAHLSYEQYVNVIHQYPDQYFDLVLVDGRSRPSCVKASIRHIKQHGWLIVDNMERDYYRTAFGEIFETDFDTILDRRSPMPFHPDFIVTLILRKK